MVIIPDKLTNLMTARARENKNMLTAIKEMSKKKLGLVCCKEKNGKINILTDGATGKGKLVNADNDCFEG